MGLGRGRGGGREDKADIKRGGGGGGREDKADIKRGGVIARK